MAEFYPEGRAAPMDYTMKMSSRYHRLLIYDVKSTAKIDGHIQKGNAGIYQYENFNYYLAHNVSL